MTVVVIGYRCPCGAQIRVTQNSTYTEPQWAIDTTVEHTPPLTDERCRLYVEVIADDERRRLRHVLQSMQLAWTERDHGSPA